MSRKLTIRQLIDKIRRSIAIDHYIRFKDRSGLDDLGVSPRSLKRSGGRPPNTKFSNEDIVQLVYKQKWQAGKPFTNANGADNNQCFYGVADAQGLSVSQVREKWKAVPAARRKVIEQRLVQLLRQHKMVHPKKQNKADRFPPPK